MENLSDTSLKIMKAEDVDATENLIVLKKANVVFPEILTGNEEQSIEYVEKFSVARKDYLVRTYNRSKKLFPKAEAILHKYNIPREFRVLLALESGFNANAVSKAGAVGYWQIMDEVAREYGMRIAANNRKYSHKQGRLKKGKTIAESKLKKPAVADDRRNFNKSTHVAARYLRDRCRNLNNDWLLITASYNCGVGNVWNAMDKCGKAKPTFWDIKQYLPAETRSYVMNFIALNVIFKNYDAFSRNKLCFRDETITPDQQEEDICEDMTASASDY